MVTLKNGDILKLVATFQHRGAAFSGARVYAALGKKSVIGGFDEKPPMVVFGNVTGIIADANWINYTFEVLIPITNIGTIGFPAGSDYEVYAKLIDIPGRDIIWYGLDNDITLEAPLGAAEFANLKVTYSKV